MGTATTAKRHATRWAERILRLIGIVGIVAFGTFLLGTANSESAVYRILGPDRPESDYAELREKLQLDEPILVRFSSWALAALRGDFGQSMVPPNQPVIEKLGAALAVSLELTFVSLFISVIISLALTVIAVRWRGGTISRIVDGISFAALSVPSFVASLILIGIFVTALGWLPRADWVRWSEGSIGAHIEHAVLPVVALCVMQIGMLTRTLKDEVIDTMNEDFIEAARVKGNQPSWVIIREALRPSLIPYMTVLGVLVGSTLGSAAVVEAVFGLPGLGTLLVNAAKSGDFPVLQAGVLMMVIIYLIANAIVDALYGLVDPRMRN